MTPSVLSRRALLQGSAMLGAGALMPVGMGRAFAADVDIAAQWPAVTAMLDGYVSAHKLAGMTAAIGWGDQGARLYHARQGRARRSRRDRAGQPVPDLFDDQADHRHGGDDPDR
jgi:hypothetical protein